MKYKNHTIQKVYQDLGESKHHLNYIFEIYNASGDYLMSALTLSSAKNYIDSGYDENYL